MNSIKPWLRFFRLPNLPTAPGDALAGAALALAAFPELFAEGTPAAVAAGAASFFFYLFGLADNDVAGAASDAQLAPERPIPRGEISLRAAKAARAASLAAALLAGAAARLPPAWWCVAALLAAAVLAYNRVKGAWLMGACRGLSLVAGGAALCRAGLFRRPDWSIPGDPGTMFAVFWTSLLLAALGWTLYIAAVTLLSEGEERESEGLGNRRYLFGLAAFAPLAALVPAVALRMALPDPRITPTFLLFPLLGCLWTFASWCAAVAPLWRAHGPAERRRAVGSAIGALLYLQIGFMLVAPERAFLALAAVAWGASRTIRRFAPDVSGS
jgi:4-hydroxybenzoate polyprenyltransferase